MKVPAIIIENHVPMLGSREKPDCKTFALRQALRSMKPGDSFLWPDNKAPYRAATMEGATIRTLKQKSGGWRIWLVEKLRP